jgi:hypothetical protein
VPLPLTNVCFEGKNGHDAGGTPFPLMTHSGHTRSRHVVFSGIFWKAPGHTLGLARGITDKDVDQSAYATRSIEDR